jgi:6-pyruvoyltetrahydropterin/6-carboxytetrahydropterin synthase
MARAETRALIRKEFTFEASHILPNHGGKCSRLHGHSYLLEVFVEGEISPVQGVSWDGMVMDFGDLSQAVNGTIIEHIDHRHLNDFPPFAEGQAYHPPSAENIACFIYEALSSIIRAPGDQTPEDLEASPVKKVRVWEGRKAWAEYPT